MNPINLILLITIGITALILLSILFLRKKTYEPITKSFYALGTLINLKAIGKNAELAIEETVLKLNEIDDNMSAFKSSSDISKINMSSGKDFQSVNEDTYSVVKSAVKYSEILEGSFDPTIRPLVTLWNIGKSNESIPAQKEIDEKRKLVNYKDILFDDATSSIKLSKPNQAIDVGGIAKGFAADVVKDIFLKHKVNSGIIDLGGNVYALGCKDDGTDWKVGIQDPFKQRGEFMGIVTVRNKSVVTSGNYEKYFMKDGRVFHHIIDPTTGYPSESEIISATIVSDNSIDGDGLSTGVYILGVEKSMKLIESMEGLDALFITKDKKVFITSGLKPYFQIANKDYTYKSI